MNRIVLSLVTFVALVGTAAAQSSNPAQTVIRARQASYKQMGAAMKSIVEQSRSDTPSRPMLLQSTERILYFSRRISRWFPRGSGPETGIPTHARPEIWTDRAGFTRAAAGLEAAARRFGVIAQRGEPAAIRAAVPMVANACRACHDRFRVDEH